MELDEEKESKDSVLLAQNDLFSPGVALSFLLVDDTQCSDPGDKQHQSPRQQSAVKEKLTYCSGCVGEGPGPCTTMFGRALGLVQQCLGRPGAFPNKC